jgi:hypothetical protein
VRAIWRASKDAREGEVRLDCFAIARNDEHEAIAIHLTGSCVMQVICPSCQSAAGLSLAPSDKSIPLICRPVPDKRGASRSSRTLGAGCDGCDARD